MKTVRKFESNRHRLNPTCPCGKSNRDGKFSPQKGYAGMNVGHCHSCGKDFWDEEGSIVEATDFKEEVPVFCTPDMQELIDHFDESMKSDFAQFLIRMFGEEEAKNAVSRYYLGVLDSAHGADLNSDVIFWQIDKEKNLRAGKVMRYGKDGKRQGYPKWWHKIKESSCQVNQYFFGGHLIDEVKTDIGVVESEKTATIMSICQPNITWIACGGATHLQDNKCSTLPMSRTILFPDVDFYNDWEQIANKWGFQISRECELWHKEGMLEKGDDIADYYLTLVGENTVEKIDPNWNQAEYDAIFKKPENFRSDIYTGRTPLSNKNDFS